MTEYDIEKIDRIVSDLLMEFKQERNNLQIELDNANAKIMEIDRSISSFKENEDVDIKVFSPRNLSNLNIEKIELMNSEKNKIEESSKSVIRHLNYYTDKCDKLDEIRSILHGNVSVSKNDKIDDIAKMFSVDVTDNFEQDKSQIDIDTDKFTNNKNYSDNDLYKKSDFSEGTSDRVEKTEKISVSDNISILVESNQVINKANSILNNSNNDELSNYDKLSLLKELESLSHRLEILIKIIDNDVYRTKMEMKSMKSNLDDLINSIRDSLK